MRWLLLILAACSARPAPAPTGPDERYTGPRTPAQKGGEIVAEVNGEPIYAADVARQMAARGQTASQAADELIAAELLAQAAFQRGLADDPEVIAARKRERVRAYIDASFVASFDGPEDVPAADIDMLLKRPVTRAYFDHDVFHTCGYVRVDLPKDAPADAALAARVRAEAFHALARDARPRTLSDFYALVAKMPPGMKISTAPKPYSTTLAHGPAVEPFARAAFTLEKVGDISAPARTPWGWDILYLTDIIPERHATRAEIEADLKPKIFDESRRHAWSKLMDRLLAAHKIAVNEAALELVQVDAVLGISP